MKATEPAPVTSAQINQFSYETRAQITPLARAALQNGVAFDDVAAYCEGRNTKAPTFGECDEIADMALDQALERSAAAMYAKEPAKNLEAARLWWRGVL